jgi:hypothetical protein
MHQQHALREMARVLKPSGKMIISFIGLGYRLRHVVFPEKKGLRQRIGNLKDLVMGFLLQVTGFQPSRRTLWGWSVPFTSPMRLRRQIRRLSCRITSVEPEASYLGVPTVRWIILEKTTLA